MKYCPRCVQWRPLTEFGVKSSGLLQPYCRGCQRRYQRDYYDRHKEYYAKLQAERVARNRQMLREAKSRPCADCGLTYPVYVMDFDHRPGEKKCFPLANAAGWTRISMARLKAEIDKCDVACANCHRIRTHRRRKAALEQKKQAAVAQG